MRSNRALGNPTFRPNSLDSIAGPVANRSRMLLTRKMVAAQRRRRKSGDQSLTEAGRLVSIRQAAAYLGLGVWTVRDLIHSGYLARVALPSSRRPGETMRRILVDRADLDTLIDRFREKAAPYATDERDRALQVHFSQQAPARTSRVSSRSSSPESVPRPGVSTPLGRAPDVTPTDVRETVRLDGEEGDYWCRILRNGVDTNGLFRCCLKQIVYGEQQGGPKTRNGAELICPFCQTRMGISRHLAVCTERFE